MYRFFYLISGGKNKMETQTLERELEKIQYTLRENIEKAENNTSYDPIDWHERAQLNKKIRYQR